MDYHVAMETRQRDWRRGIIRPAALVVVERAGRAHGYEISGALAGIGLGAVAGGTLYPILRRLEDDGLLTSEWAAGEGGPGRKLYSVTSLGAAEAGDFKETLAALAESVTNFTKE